MTADLGEVQLQYLLAASVIYSGVLVLGILFWAWRNSRDRLYLSRGLPPALLEKFPQVSPKERFRAFRWGIPVLGFLVLFPLVYSTVARNFLGDGFFEVLVVNLTLLLSYNVVDLLVVDWLVLCWITPRFFVVPGTEGDPGYKDYAFHFRGALRGLVFVAVGSLVFTVVVEVVHVLAETR